MNFFSQVNIPFCWSSFIPIHAGKKKKKNQRKQHQSHRFWSTDRGKTSFRILWVIFLNYPLNLYGRRAIFLHFLLNLMDGKECLLLVLPWQLHFVFQWIVSENLKKTEIVFSVRKRTVWELMRTTRTLKTMKESGSNTHVHEWDKKRPQDVHLLTD